MGRLRIRTANAEIEIEVDGDAFGGALQEALQAIEKLSANTPQPRRSESAEGAGTTRPVTRSDASINTVVARLGGGSARSILKAAAVHLTLVDGLDLFTREAWIARAREARDWQAGYSPNQARDIKRLTDQGEVIEKSGNKYSIPSRAANDARRLLLDE